MWLVGIASPRNSPARRFDDETREIGNGEARPVAGGFPSGIQERQCATIDDWNPLPHGEDSVRDVRRVDMEVDHAFEPPIYRGRNGRSGISINRATDRLRSNRYAERSR
jgi:hypothetical protein